MYQRKRNLVTRADGVLVNVARFRGQLFVCASACCCGRTDDGFAPVPSDLYHNEWERRRLRNIVHLSIGGCLGPCALANVVLLLFDGEALWFHSINSDERVLALYDYIEAMLDADGVVPAPAAVAQYQFSASAWQDRPDGRPVDDRRLWETRKASPASGHACEAPAFFQVDAAAEPERVVADMQGAAAMPRKNGELVFDAPWQGRAFGLVAGLHEEGLYDWDEFRDRLIAEIAAAEKRAEAFDYYNCWLRAFEDLLTSKGIVSVDEVEERTSEFEFGEREEVF
ncbi:MAG: nitrile hydratase accessory protein [Dehalococcoidia bacterium]